MKVRKKIKILMSIPTQSHVVIAEDELDGLKHLGYLAARFSYAGKEGITSRFGRLMVVLSQAFLLVIKAHKFSPDVIYFNSRLETIACFRDFLTLLLLRIFYWKKVSIIIKSHGSDVEMLEDQSFIIRKIVLAFLREQVNAWLFLSSQETQLVLDNGFLPSGTVFVTKNIVRVNQFRKTRNFRSDHAIGEDAIILLFAGRLIRQKGVFEVLDAFKRITEEQNAVLIFVGDGPEKQTLEELTESSKLKNKVIFTGMIAEHEVVPYYSNADILVFPTYFPEGFPMALFNAVGAGLSIVTTRTRAAIDYLSTPANCLWVDPQDSISVVYAVNRLIASPELRKSMFSANRKLSMNFNREQVCNEIDVIIKTILSLKNEH